MGIPSVNELSSPVLAALRRGPMLLALVGVVLWTQACAAIATVHHVPGSVLRVATNPNTGVGMTALAQGTLFGTINRDGTACFWLGTGADREALIWPDGVSARADPLRVIRTENGQERTFATVGDHVAVGGGLASPIKGAISVLGCGRPPYAWVVTF